VLSAKLQRVQSRSSAKLQLRVGIRVERRQEEFSLPCHSLSNALSSPPPTPANKAVLALGVIKDGFSGWIKLAS